MFIETTIHINTIGLQKLERAARKTHVSKSAFLMLILRRKGKEHSSLSRCFRRVEYQKKTFSNQWRRLHVSISAGDYEYLLDLRKLFKRSVSLLAAIALEELEDDNLLTKKQMSTDNYPDRNYLITCVSAEEYVCWKLYWGMPAKHNTLRL